MTRNEAEIIAQEVFDSQWKGRAIVRVVPEKTIEKEYGWIFFSRSEILANPKHVLLGNLPVLVTKTGEIVRIPVQIGLDKALARYEAGLPFFERKRSERASS
jgi:hypothetical protein